MGEIYYNFYSFSRRYNKAIHIERSFDKSGIYIRNSNSLGHSHDKLDDNRALSPSNVRIEGVTVVNSGNTGIHVGSFVQGAAIEDCRVYGSWGPGIHLSPGSKANWVQVPEGPNDVSYPEYPEDSIAQWHDKHGVTAS